jgi:type II secretory pathway component GspD/PulD (secretin)
MKVAILIAVSMVFAVSADCSSQVPASAAVSATGPQERLLYSVRHGDPAMFAEKLALVFKDGNVVVTAVPAANCVLISAPPQTMQEIAKLLSQMDRPPRDISIDVWIVDLQPELPKGADGGVAPTPAPFLTSGSRSAVLEQLTKQEKEGRIVVVNHVQLTTLDGMQAQAQQGERKPRVAATNLTTRGRVSTVTFDNIGTIVKMHPRVVNNNELVIAVNLEKSCLASEARGVPIDQPNNGPEVRTASSIHLTSQATVNVKSGDMVPLVGLKSTPADVAGSYQVLISAEVLPEAAVK